MAEISEQSELGGILAEKLKLLAIKWNGELDSSKNSSIVDTPLVNLPKIFGVVLEFTTDRLREKLTK